MRFLPVTQRSEGQRSVMTGVCPPSLSKTPGSLDSCTAGQTVTVGLCMSLSSLAREAGRVHGRPLPAHSVRGAWPAALPDRRRAGGWRRAHAPFTLLVCLWGVRLLPLLILFFFFPFL